MTLEGIVALVALVISAASVALSIIMSRPQRLKMRAETSKIFQDMLAKEVEKGIAKDGTILEMKSRIGCLEVEVKELRVENCGLRDENRVLRSDNVDLRDWATRLVQQVVEAKKTPVKMRKKATA